MSKRKLLGKLIPVGLVLSLMLSMLTFGCAEETTTTDDTDDTDDIITSKYGGVLRVVITTDVGVIGNPPTKTSPVAFTMVTFCVESLLAVGEYDQVVPFLATGWEASDDLLSLTLTLREGVKFHDGTDFNAEAVKWNLMRYVNEGQYAFIDAITSVDIIDDYTVRLNLSVFENTLLDELTFDAGMMISPTAFENAGTTDEERIEWAEKNPVGTGPFKFVSWERDFKHVYERNDDYWQEGKPYLDGVEFVIIADPMTAKASLLAGEVDMLLTISPKEAADLEATGDFTMLTKPEGWIGYIGDSGDPESPFADLRVRQAVDYAIDRQAIADALFYGYASVSNQLVPEGHGFYNPDVVGYSYNPTEAKRLLAEAGYEDGLETTLIVQNEKLTMDVATAVQGYLTEIGINAVMEIGSSGWWLEKVLGGSWDGLLGVGITDVPSKVHRMVKLLFTKDANFWVERIKPDDIDDVVFRANQTPIYEEQQALIQELMKLMVDKYCLWSNVVVRHSITICYKEIHDTRMDWRNPTPYDAWIEQK